MQWFVSLAFLKQVTPHLSPLKEGAVATPSGIALTSVTCMPCTRCCARGPCMYHGSVSIWSSPSSLPGPVVGALLQWNNLTKNSRLVFMVLYISHYSNPFLLEIQMILRELRYMTIHLKCTYGKLLSWDYVDLYQAKALAFCTKIH